MGHSTLYYLLSSAWGASIYNILAQAYLSGRPRWTSADMPVLTGKVAIVTGGTSGIGKDTVKALLLHNVTVYLAARNPAKAEDVLKELKEATGKDAIFLKLDLADLRSVKAAAEEFISKEKELHYLFNNGGVMLRPIDELTAQGYDSQFGTNVLGHFYLTKLLLPTILSTAESTREMGRIVTTSSSVSLFGHTWRFDTLIDGPERRQMHSGEMYTASKVGDALLAQELAKRYGDKGIVANYCNPGNLKTGLSSQATGLLKVLLSLLLIWPSQWGSFTLLWAAFGPGSENTNGKYIIPWGRVGRPGPCLRDPKLSGKLWDWMEEQVKGV